MGDVFSKADNVIIWLGNESDDSGTAFNALNKLYFNYYKKSRISKSPLSEKIATGSIPTVDVLESLPPKSALTDREWEALKNLLHRPWFHRLWVYQEAANAKSAVFKCGGAEIPWDNLSKALAYLSHYDLASAFLDAHSAFACTHVAAMERARSRPAPEPLFHAVLTSSYGACSDPRDKIFAVMSIADGKDVFDWEVSFDYSLPVFDLFRRFAIWDIVRCGSLRSLSCASAPLPDGLSSLQLPSWAPDWTHFNNPNILARFKNTSGFAAAGSNEMDVWFTHNKTVLHAKGIIVDSIQSLSSSPAPIKSTALFDISEKTIDGLTNAYEWLLECWDLAAASKAMTPARYDTFWRTMLCGLTADGRPAPRSYAGYFIKYLQFLRITPGELNSLLYTDWHDSPSDDWLIPEREQRFQVYFNGQYTSTARIEDALKVWTPHRRFCITTEGRLALVPDHAAPGDTIAVLFGSEVPYCLRLQEDGTYTVIGECYLHGMMHGEALQLPASEHGPAIIRMR